MLVEAIFAAAFQIGPFYEQKDDYAALRPLWSDEGQTTDVVWPLFTAHENWWRFCYFVHYQDYPDDNYQFEIMPLWWQGRDRLGFFPLFGHHPHILFMEDIDFALWPLWMRYKVKDKTTNTVLFPFIHWRSDGAWGFWPLYVQNHQRDSDHRTVLWPIVTWANYRQDLDTAGAGYSWMFWPLYASVERERESQTSFLPPLFSYAKVPDGYRLRAPWPLFELEKRRQRERLSVFPFYEQVDLHEYAAGGSSSSVTRFGWRLVELYENETRVFPFWTSTGNDSYFRLWPFYEREGSHSWFLALFPIRWVDAVDRNWAKYWTFYERDEGEKEVRHSLFWNIIHWSIDK